VLLWTDIWAPCKCWTVREWVCSENEKFYFCCRRSLTTEVVASIKGQYQQLHF
jgi:hypothetical protein